MNLYREQGGVPSLERGFVGSLYFSEGRNTVLGGRSNKKQPHESQFVYLEVTGPVRAYTLKVGTGRQAPTQPPDGATG